MYIASQVGNRSTTQIGKFYNGRDHSTVCYAIGRIRSLRETDPEVDGLLTILTTELRERMQSKRKSGPRPNTLSASQIISPLDHEDILDALSDRIASRVLVKLTVPRSATASVAEGSQRSADASDVLSERWESDVDVPNSAISEDRSFR